MLQPYLLVCIVLLIWIAKARQQPMRLAYALQFVMCKVSHSFTNAAQQSSWDIMWQQLWNCVAWYYSAVCTRTLLQLPLQCKCRENDFCEWRCVCSICVFHYMCGQLHSSRLMVGFSADFYIAAIYTCIVQLDMAAMPPWGHLVKASLSSLVTLCMSLRADVT